VARRPIRRPRRRGVLGAAALAAVTGLVLGAAPAGASAPAGPNPTQPAVDQQRADASYQALEQVLYLPSDQLYQASSPTPTDPFSFLWPFTNAMAATSYLVATPGGSADAADLTARLDGLLLYQDPAEHTPTGTSQPPAFESAVAPPLGLGGDTYYDDNAWAALDLLAQYRLTGSATTLDLAEQTFRFVVSGWSTLRSAPCRGGVSWVDASWSADRNTVSNAPNAEAGAELYQLTGDAFYLSWARRMYDWVNRCLAAPGGLYDDHISMNGTVTTTEWSYNQGTMIGAGVLLYRATGKAGYLKRAEATAQAAVALYGTGSLLDDQGPAFNGIYFSNLFLLNEISPNALYASDAEAYGTYMWDQQRDPSTGLFVPTSDVNATAPMVTIYSLLAGSPP